MVEILLKCNGIEMPKNGTLTLVVHPNGDIYLGDVLTDVKIGKAIELQPHGDLIDRKELLKYDNITCVDTGYWLTEYDAVKTSVIKNVPVIVEASTKETA